MIYLFASRLLILRYITLYSDSFWFYDIPLYILNSSNSKIYLFVFRILPILRYISLDIFPSFVFILYNSLKRPKIEYYSHIWAGAAESSLWSVDRLPKPFTLSTSSFLQRQNRKPILTIPMPILMNFSFYFHHFSHLQPAYTKLHPRSRIGFISSVSQI